MASSPLVLTQLIKCHVALQTVIDVMQTKMDALLDSQPLYKLLDIEAEKHPYFALVGETKKIQTDYADLVAAIKRWKISGLTIEGAMNLLHSNQVQQSATLTSLISIPSAHTPVTGCADLVLNIFLSIARFRSHATTAALKRDLKTRMGIRDTSRHLEVPFIDIATQNNVAFKEIKTLIKLLLDLSIDTTSVREKLMQKQSMIILTATGNTQTQDPNIAYLLKM